MDHLHSASSLRVATTPQSTHSTLDIQSVRVNGLVFYAVFLLAKLRQSGENSRVMSAGYRCYENCQSSCRVGSILETQLVSNEAEAFVNALRVNSLRKRAITALKHTSWILVNPLLSSLFCQDLKRL